MPALQGNDVVRCAREREAGVMLRWRRLKLTLLKGQARTAEQKKNRRPVRLGRGAPDGDGWIGCAAYSAAAAFGAAAKRQTSPQSCYRRHG